jgi:glycogen operon protein
VGEGGYQVGGFPWPFREWNDKFRDDTRAFWRKDPGKIPEMSERLLGSPVQFKHSHRPATSSVNFVAAHDGFTLWDTVSYNDKHNEANGEDNRDGHDNNLSDNMGVEGPTEDATVNAARERRARAMLASLLLSQGVPMLLAGDEMGQTQGGNNNAYAQDNEIAWIDWSAPREGLLSAVRDLAAFRAEARLARLRFGAPPGEGVGDGPIARWLHPEGRDMTEEDWHDDGLRLFGADLSLPGGPRLLILLNAGDAAEFALPEGAWRLRIDTARDRVACDEPAGPTAAVDWQSVQVFWFEEGPGADMAEGASPL